MTDAAAELSWQRPFAGHEREQPYVRLVNVGDRPDEEQLIVYPRVVARDPGGQGPAEGAPLVTQRGVLGDAGARASSSWRRSSDTALRSRSSTGSPEAWAASASVSAALRFQRCLMRPATCESTVSMAGDRAVFNYPNRVFERHRSLRNISAARPSIRRTSR